MVLQQQVNLLDKFVIQQESIPHLVQPSNNSNTSQTTATLRNIGNSTLLLKTNEMSLDPISKSVSKVLKMDRESNCLHSFSTF